MIIMHMSGGFGNQLYSYAFGYLLTKHRKEEYWIDTAIQDADWFFRNPDIMKMNIKYDKHISYKIGRTFLERGILNKLRFKNAVGWKTKKIHESDIPSSDEWLSYCVNMKGNIYVQGNWTKASLYEPIRDELLELFSFKNELSTDALKVLREINETQNPIAIHIRRGDYVKIGMALKPNYYKDAMARIAEKVDNPVFFCFSEDLNWTKEQFKDVSYDIRYPKYESDDKGIEDFRLISQCKHQIISNSSYSWWAAYLNNNADKMVVCPCEKVGLWAEDVYPNEWIKLPFECIGKS